MAGRLARLRSGFAHVRVQEGWGGAALALAKHGRSYFAYRLRAAQEWARLWPDRMVRGVLFVGYAEGALGLGQSFRALLGALPHDAPRFAVYPFGRGIETRRSGPFMPERYDMLRRYAINVIEMAADQLPHMFDALQPRRTRRSYNILRTYWELPAAPTEWAPLLADIQEIWAPTRFVAEAFRGIFPGPITVVPPCVDVSHQQMFDRAHFGMRPGQFTFVFSFDYLSHPARKNPVGLVQAFQAAFPAERGVGLLVKSIGAAADESGVSTAMASAAAADPRIVLLDGSLSRDEMLSLLRVADCYVSLHRSEGFGLGMAEAMAFGTPVIGTDYSGNADFLSAHTGFPVACTLRPVGAEEYVATAGQVWAEPDLADAVAVMRQVFGDLAAARARAQAGQAFMQTHFGRGIVGAAVTHRLRQILPLD